MPRNGPKRSLAGRQSILDATRDLLAKHGPSQVTVDQIASQAGVGKQTIYRWWPTKGAVTLEALEQWCEGENPLPETGSARNDLALQMTRVAEMFASPIGATIRELIAEAQGDNGLLADFRKRFFDVREERAMSVIQNGVDRGELRADLDVGVATDLLYGSLWLRLLIEHRPLKEAAIAELLAIAWPGMAAAPETLTAT